MRECSFTPRVNAKSSTGGSSVNPAARPMGEARFHHLHEDARRPQREERPLTFEERELAECTFKPALTAKYTPAALAHQPTPHGFEQAVERQRRPVEERAAAEAAEAEAAKRRAANNALPPKRFELQTERRADRRQPLLYMDVNLGPGRTGRIGLHEGDEPEELAASFAKTYQLDATMQARLTALIEKYMAEMLAQATDGEGVPSPSTSPADAAASEEAAADAAVEVS